MQESEARDDVAASRVVTAITATRMVAPTQRNKKGYLKRSSKYFGNMEGQKWRNVGRRHGPNTHAENFAYLPPKGRLQMVDETFNRSAIGRDHLVLRQSNVRRIVRSDWTLTPLEAVLFIAGVTLAAGGFVWAAGIG